ncbi:MAG: twin-arginine translocase TatA/TatE family subunit [Candidatus Dadabacteria bacterium]|nr:MAG: twin-arginine translocase TatA/TatE family subunit [Candidatus Dadabacteria bacterium]
MFGLGVPELIIILVIILIMFGAGKLPEIGEGLGRGIRNFRRSLKAPDEIDVTPREGEKEVESDQQGAPPKQP